MARHIDLPLLRAFAAVADHRGMTAASRVLNLTQGAVSQQIARLEDFTRAALFVRTRQGLRLTPAGERLLGKARRLLALNDEICTELAGGATSGPVRLGVPYDLVGTVLAPALKTFADACPHVELSLTCGASPDLAAAVAAGQLDLAVVEQPADLVAGECLAIERLVWIGANGGRAYERAPLPVSLVAGSCAFRPGVMAALKREHRAWRMLVENGSVEASFARVRADLAVSACLAATVPAGIDILPPTAGLPPLPAFAIALHLAGRASAASAELAQQIRHTIVRRAAAA